MAFISICKNSELERYEGKCSRSTELNETYCPRCLAENLRNQINLKQKEIDLLEKYLNTVSGYCISESEMEAKGFENYDFGDFQGGYEDTVKIARETKQELLKIRGL